MISAHQDSGAGGGGAGGSGSGSIVSAPAAVVASRPGQDKDIVSSAALLHTPATATVTVSTTATTATVATATVTATTSATITETIPTTTTTASSTSTSPSTPTLAPAPASLTQSGRLLTIEEKEVGDVSRTVYLQWLGAAGGAWVGLALVALNYGSEALAVLASWWLSYWSEQQGQAHSSTGVSPWPYLGVYVAINVGVSLSSLAKVRVRHHRTAHPRPAWSTAP